MSDKSLSDKFIRPFGYCRICGWLKEEGEHKKDCPVLEIAQLEVKAKHFDAIIGLTKVDGYDEITMQTIYDYCEENDINIAKKD